MEDFTFQLIQEHPTVNYYEVFYGLVDILYTVWQNLMEQLIVYDRKVNVLIHHSLSSKLCHFILNILETECSYGANYFAQPNHIPLTKDIINQYDLVISNQWQPLNNPQKFFHLVNIYENFTRDIQQRLFDIRISWFQEDDNRNSN